MLASRPWLVQPPEIPQNEQLHLFRGRPKLLFYVGLIAPTGGGLACGRSKRSIQVPKLTHQYMSKKCTSLPSIPESRGWVNKLLRRSCVPPFCDAGNRGGGRGGAEGKSGQTFERVARFAAWAKVGHRRCWLHHRRGGCSTSGD